MYCHVCFISPAIFCVFEVGLITGLVSLVFLCIAVYACPYPKRSVECLPVCLQLECVVPVGVVLLRPSWSPPSSHAQGVWLLPRSTVHSSSPQGAEPLVSLVPDGPLPWLTPLVCLG